MARALTKADTEHWAVICQEKRANARPFFAYGKVAVEGIEDEYQPILVQKKRHANLVAAKWRSCYQTARVVRVWIGGTE